MTMFAAALVAFAAASTHPKTEPKPETTEVVVDEIPIPFLTLVGNVGLLARPYTWVQELDFIEDRTRTDSHLGLLGGARLLGHLDLGHVVPYADAALGGGSSLAFDASAGVIAGARFHTALSFVGITRREAREGNYIRVTEEKTTLRWGPERYPLVVGGQAGIGVQGFGALQLPARGDFKGQTLPGGVTPRLEVGAALLGQHHVSALLTFDVVKGVVGLRGHLLQRIPIGWFWFAVGLSYEVAFNNPQSRPYDFSVTGTLGVGFSRG
ncbi:MAG: hypothetical protein JNK82_41485 [Myxococcaceae bacterium]|nr:hypothetical protein [Myxococcaceae bacterium]